MTEQHLAIIFLTALIAIYFAWRLIDKSNRPKKFGWIILYINIGYLLLGVLFSAFQPHSTPIEAKTQNLTDKELKVFSITFYDSVNYSYKDKITSFLYKVSPNETQTKSIEVDGAKKVWIVAIDRNDKLYLLFKPDKYPFENLFIDISEKNKATFSENKFVLNEVLNTQKNNTWADVLLTIQIIFLIALILNLNKERIRNRVLN